MKSLFSKYILGFLVLIFSSSCTFSQDGENQPPKPKYPKWTATFTPSEFKAGQIVTVIIKGVIDKDWYVYSNDFSPEVGPNLAEFVWEKSTEYQLVGGAKPIGNHKEMDEVFGGEISKFEHVAEFRQTIKILKDHTTIKGKLVYQTCSMITGMCVVDKFKFSLTDGKSAPISDTASSSSAVVAETIDSVQKNVEVIDTVGSKSETKIESSNDSSPAAPVESLWTTLLLAFGAGLLVLLTPCVFPMIPMTVSFFTKLSESEGGKARARMNGLIFGISIIVIYTIPGTLISVIGGVSFANWLSTHWVPNILFFAIFILFGASFLGMFEINLSGDLVNKVDNKSSRSSILGIFFMAFTLVLVSFSCTGPIVSNVLIGAIDGNYLNATLVMFSFSSAMALPFVLFSWFPQYMQKLPKSGGWLNSVKVSFGFIELAAAFKFLSVPDQTYHWGLLDREVYLSIWIVIFALWGFYLLGKLKLSHDSDLPYLSVPRLSLAITVLAFTVYMIPGLWGAPLKALSGFLPPMESQDFVIGESTSAAVINDKDFPSKVRFGDKLKLPHHLQGFFDFKEAAEYSKKVNKPIFIDFTGHGCVNCRLMESNVWSDPKVLQILRKDYVVVALYADDKTTLPESEWYTSKADNEVKKTIGDQVGDFQYTNYKGAAQPQYVLVNAEGKRLISYDKFYDPKVENFVKFLEEGKAAFSKE
ncbi:MAG: thioredoxin family protein [Bacteroidetes bacterium]|nr:thioredoxin family protein [Bacteroidota bacterium]